MDPVLTIAELSVVIEKECLIMLFHKSRMLELVKNLCETLLGNYLI